MSGSICLYFQTDLKFFRHNYDSRVSFTVLMKLQNVLQNAFNTYSQKFSAYLIGYFHEPPYID